MKKIILAAFFIVVLAPAVFAWPKEEHSRAKRMLYVECRGLTNAVSLPLEISHSVSNEPGNHKWLWPVTVFPRTFTNVVIRFDSLLNDLFFFPPVAAFTENLTPVTEHFGLPEFPWQGD